MVVPLALASGLGVLTPQELEVGAAVVDIGAGGTQVGLFSGGSVTYAAFIPIGAGHVTSDLTKLLKISPEEAERLKRIGAAFAQEVSPGEPVEVMQIGQTTARPLDRRVLCEIIESRMREIATMVKQQLEKSGHFGTLPGGVVVTGGGSLLPATDRLFESVFGHVKARCAAPKAVGPGGKLASTPAFSGAVGLARFALDSEDDELCIAGGSPLEARIARAFGVVVAGKFLAVLVFEFEPGVERRAGARGNDSQLVGPLRQGGELEPIFIAGFLNAAGHRAGDGDGLRRASGIIRLVFANLHEVASGGWLPDWQD